MGAGLAFSHFTSKKFKREPLSVHNPLYLKAIIIFILILWISDFLRKKKKKPSDPAIAEADARERYAWRYVRWFFRIIRGLLGFYIIASLIHFLLT